ncbi:MAG: H/ACA ribonucleoprotein complex subunit 4, partial [archaeon GW2011_AR18]
MDALLKAGKEYICLMHIHSPVSESEIRESANKLIGKITQLPPLKSAVKREFREREVYYMEILEIRKQDVLFIIGCQAGTYVRRYCDDFGKM